MSKPPTQVAGVVGIASMPVTMNEPSRTIDWARLVTLPPFQMWAAQRMATLHPGGRNSEEHARDVVQRLGMGPGVFADYADWHAAKGYWPNEDPFGRTRR